MYISPDNLISYLVQRGVLTKNDILDKDWFILQDEPKKPVLRVSTFSGNGWIVKQPSPLDNHSLSQLDREAYFFQLVSEVEWAKPLKPLLPKLLLYDPGVHVLIMEQINHDTGFDYLRRQSADPSILGRLLGKAFAMTHVDIGNKNNLSQMLSVRLPWILQLNKAQIDDIDPPSVREIFEIVRRDSNISELLTGLEMDWRSKALIHGDAKLDNILVKAASRSKVWLIDWSFAGIGDPIWDIGSIIQSSLMLWLQGVSFKQGQSFDEAAKQSTLPISLPTSFIKAFLSTYMKSTIKLAMSDEDFIKRSFRFSGAALIQTAVSQARSQDFLSTRQLVMLQMGSNFLNNPDEVAKQFFYAP